MNEVGLYSMRDQWKRTRAHRWAIICLLALLNGCTPAEESLGEREVRYQRQIVEDPTDAEAHYALGQVYHEQARYPRGPTILSPSLGAGFHPYRSAGGIGNILFKQGELDQAAQAYQRAAQGCADCTDAHRGLGPSICVSGALRNPVKPTSRRF